MGIIKLIKNGKYTIRILLLYFILSGFFIVNINAQSLPVPFYYFPLDGDNPSQWIDSNNISHSGVRAGIIRGTNDRFGNSYGALSFESNDASIFAGDSIPVISAADDVSISFWVYLDSAHVYPSGSSPFSPGDLKKRFFSLTTDYKSGGMARVDKNALLGVERTISKDSTITPWYLWLYKPAMFDIQGWYHIVTVMSTDFTNIYMYKPDGTKVCKYNFMENNFPKKLVIGNMADYFNENVMPASVMDDFKFWKIALTEQQADELNAGETNIIGGTYRISLVRGSDKYIQTSYHSLSTGSRVELYQLAGQQQYDYNYRWNIQAVLGGGYTISMYNTSNGLNFSTEAQIASVFLGGLDKTWHFESTGNPHEYRIWSRGIFGYKTYLSTYAPYNSTELYTNKLGSTNFQAFKLESVYNPREDIEGIYTVKLSASSSPSKYMQTSYHSLDNGANVELFQIKDHEEYYYNYKWDFIRLPDNSYRIRMNNTDKYLNTSNQGTGNSTNIQLYQFQSDGERGYDWVLVPTGKENEYYIRLAAALNRYAQTSSHATGNSANINLYEIEGLQIDKYKWTLQEVKNPWIGVEGTYTVQLSASSSPPKYMQTSDHSLNNSANVSLYQLEGEKKYYYNYKWDFIRLSDNSYRIRMNNTDKYLNTSGQGTVDSTNIQLYQFQQDGERGYDWILEPTGQENEYYIRLAATLDRYMQTSSHATGNGANIDLYREEKDQMDKYKWTLVEVS